MSLKFYLLNWVYHDAWKWRENKGVIRQTSTGPEVIDVSNTYYQKGHCHLFFSDYDE